MMDLKRFVCATVALFACYGASASGQDWNLTVHGDQPGARINPHFYGLMTEEINHAYDGGLYAELIQNRSFKDDDNSPAHWSVVQGDAGSAAPTIELDRSDPVNAGLSVSLKLVAGSAAQGQREGVANEGYWGIPAKPDTTYHATFYAKGDGNITGPLTLDIESEDGSTVLAKATIPTITSSWAKYETDLKTGSIPPSRKNRFVISTEKPGTIWLSFVSLFPPTFDERSFGNRPDLMEWMQGLTPSFLRFPGGNYVDPGHYQWKITIGPVDQRPGHPGAWGYRASDGLGMFEFLKWCEELHMEPLLAVSDGRGWLAADGDLAPLVKDAVDEIEYVSGPADSVWGAKRAAAGHPAPFPLHYVEIGNEDFFDSASVYDAKFTQFYDAIHARYPQLKLIATSSAATTRRPDLIDDHIYASPGAMQEAAYHYDQVSRGGPKVFVGEWATQDTGTAWEPATYNNVPPTPSLNAAISDAAYLTGLERNADVVEMACYAPLLVNVNPGARQWAQNLIGYDALHSFASPSYYMQKMFALNKGDAVLPVELEKSQTQGGAPAGPSGSIGVGTWETQAEFKDLKVTHGEQTLYPGEQKNQAAQWSVLGGDWQAKGEVLTQSGDTAPSLELSGDPAWTDYTYSLKARKTGGKEGFLILFHAQDARNCIWWNIGGWGNTGSGLERRVEGESRLLTPREDLSIATGQWYDIRIDVRGKRIQCFLDGKLMISAIDNPLAGHSPIFSSASRDDKTGDIILKIVNVASSPQTVKVDLQGIHAIAGQAAGQVLTGEPDTRNSIEHPTAVVPADISFEVGAEGFSREFAPYSVSVVRLKTH